MGRKKADAKSSGPKGSGSNNHVGRREGANIYHKLVGYPGNPCKQWLNAFRFLCETGETVIVYGQLPNYSTGQRWELSVIVWEPKDPYANNDSAAKGKSKGKSGKKEDDHRREVRRYVLKNSKSVGKPTVHKDAFLPFLESNYHIEPSAIMMIDQEMRHDNLFGERPSMGALDFQAAIERKFPDYFNSSTRRTSRLNFENAQENNDQEMIAHDVPVHTMDQIQRAKEFFAQLWPNSWMDKISDDKTFEIFNVMQQSPHGISRFVIPVAVYDTPSISDLNFSSCFQMSGRSNVETNNENEEYAIFEIMKRLFDQTCKKQSFLVDIASLEALDEQIDVMVEQGLITKWLHDPQLGSNLYISSVDYQLLERLGETIVKVAYGRKKIRYHPPESVCNFEPNDEQTLALGVMEESRFVLIEGAAGTGKTKVEFEMQRRYPGVSLVLAFTGIAIDNFSSKCSQYLGGRLNAMTIDHFLMNARTSTQFYTTTLRRTQRVHFEEASQVTFTQLFLVLHYLPHVVQLTMSGDLFQYGPIGRETSVYECLLMLFNNSMINCKLTEVRRITANHETMQLVHNAFRTLNFEEVSVLTSLNPESMFSEPFVIVPLLSTRDSAQRLYEQLFNMYPASNPSLGDLFADILVLTMKNDDVFEFNKALFQCAFPNEKTYSPTNIWRNESIRLKENFAGVTNEDNDKCSTSPLKNGNIVKIVKIVDRDPRGIFPETEVESTEAISQSANVTDRILELDNGKQINLRHYNTFVRSYCQTIYSTQSQERKYVYLRVPYPLDQRSLVVGSSRAKENLVVECKILQGMEPKVALERLVDERKTLANSKPVLYLKNFIPEFNSAILSPVFESSRSHGTAPPSTKNKTRAK